MTPQALVYFICFLGMDSRIDSGEGLEGETRGETRGRTRGRDSGKGLAGGSRGTDSRRDSLRAAQFSLPS